MKQMLQNSDLVIKAEELPPEKWEEIQNLVNQTDDIRVIDKLEKIMIIKFNRHEEINRS